MSILRTSACLLFAAAAGGCSGNAPSSQPAGAGAGTPRVSTPGLPGGSSEREPETKSAQHARCGWLGADTADEGVASFVANPDYFDAVHPKWFTLEPDGVTPRAIAFTDHPQVLEVARAHGVQIIPLIDADSPSYVRTMFSSSANIDRHVQNLVDLVESHGYDGIELDYEKLWQASDRAGYTELVQKAGAALHARGKVLTVALPALDADDGQNAFDFAAINEAVDVMHLMGYDYHYMGGGHIGPLAPRGWIADVVAYVSGIGDSSKYVLGVANYGIGNGWYGAITEAIAKCGGRYQTEDRHMAGCPLGKREAGRSPSCASDIGTLFFEDVGSIAEKAALAKEAGLGGVGYWTVGKEPNGFFDAIRAAYP